MKQFNYKFDYDKALRDKNKIIEDLDYPYFKYYITEEELKKRFDNLKNIKPHVINKQYSIRFINLPEYELKYNNMYVVIVNYDWEFSKIDEISDYFNEHCRNTCKFFGSVGTPYEMFHNNFDKLITHLKERNLEINIKNIRQMIFEYGAKNNHKECNTFRPKIIKYLISHFNAKKILDMSSGWGDRLIGAMASDIDCYHGFDPNPCLQEGYLNIIDFFKEQMINKNADLSVKLLPFEESKLEENYYDLMFTSPPYFDIEIYDEFNEKQSVKKDQSEKTWYDTYLIKWVDLISKALKKGGHMCFNINQFKNHNFVTWLINDLRNDPRFNFRGTIVYSNKDIKNPQPIFIWRKN